MNDMFQRLFLLELKLHSKSTIFDALSDSIY